MFSSRSAYSNYVSGGYTNKTNARTVTVPHISQGLLVFSCQASTTAPTFTFSNGGTTTQLHQATYTGSTGDTINMIVFQLNNVGAGTITSSQTGVKHVFTVMY